MADKTRHEPSFLDNSRKLGSLGIRRSNNKHLAFLHIDSEGTVGVIHHHFFLDNRIVGNDPRKRNDEEVATYQHRDSP